MYSIYIFQNFDIHLLYNNTPYYHDNKFVMPHELEEEATNILIKLGIYNCDDRDKIAAIIRKTKRFAFFERTARFFRTKRTSVGYPPFQKFFDWLTPVLY